MAALSWEADRKIAMLTEDSASAAEKFARLIGVTQYYANCTPASKADVLRDLKERCKRSDSILFAGDPTKDSSCYETADIGFASFGGDSAAADILSTESAPAAILRATETAKRTRSIMRQSVFGILAFKILILLLDMFGVCPLWLAIFADAGMALAAAVCALRALAPREFALEKTDAA